VKPYDHKKIEKKWQRIWEKNSVDEAKDSPPATASSIKSVKSVKSAKTAAPGKTSKPKFYALIEFPFPSGEGMHVGHLRSNTAMDIIARKRRAEGINVLYPIGWDAFGLPTENFAIKSGLPPKVVTKKNTDTFRKQLKSAGFSFDWSREINTTDPAYYKWTQWIFLQLWKHGLAYKKKMLINWCPKDKIGLANEEVVDGKCERCGTPVEKREKEQWMLAITKYADRLDRDLDTVDYLDKIKIEQRNWIGKSEGSEIEFKLTTNNKQQTTDNRQQRADSREKTAEDGQQKTETRNQKTEGSVKVFTTRADTLFGATYLVLAPEHELVQKMKGEIKNWPEVEQYIKKVKKETDIDRLAENKEKTGVELKGLKAINPANKEEIPIWIADYVLVSYGTGAIMAVPAHDERDWDFAKKFKLPVREVIEPLFEKTTEADAVRRDLPFKDRHSVVTVIKHWSEDKYLCLKWKSTDWRGFVVGGIEPGEDEITTAIREITEETGYLKPKFIKKLGGVINARFFQVVKGENRSAHFHPLYFELADGSKQEIAENEKKIHDMVWVDKKEVDQFLDWVTDMRLIWYRAMNPDSFPGRSALHESSRVSEQGIMINSGKFDGMLAEDAKKKITEFVGGKMVTTYKLRDWVFSRQRYWGEPIPMIFCQACEKKQQTKDNRQQNVGAGWIPVPEKDLPVKLPEVKDYQPTDTGESPLAADDPAMRKWRTVKCPVCGAPARRETDTMPNWAGSSWYFLRYVDPKNKKELAAPKKLDYWMKPKGVDWYNGGMEHTTLHLLYSRFWNKFLFDIGVVPTSEPYQKRTSHGLILAEDGEKMSKSRGNIVNPDSIIENVGADTLRLYEMFMGPFDQTVAWNTDGIVGPRRFLERVWRLQEKMVKKAPYDSELESLIHRTIKKVSDDIEAMAFNTAISAMMILVNELEKKEKLADGYYENVLKLLAPFAPHITEEIWRNLGHKTSIHAEKWPKADETKIQQATVTIIVQINGKVRGSFSASSAITESEAKNSALALLGINKWLENKAINKVIFVKGRLINLVTD
jgi:leucyl-tRNA synthetase